VETQKISGDAFQEQGEHTFGVQVEMAFQNHQNNISNIHHDTLEALLRGVDALDPWRGPSIPKYPAESIYNLRWLPAESGRGHVVVFGPQYHVGERQLRAYTRYLNNLVSRLKIATARLRVDYIVVAVTFRLYLGATTILRGATNRNSLAQCVDD